MPTRQPELMQGSVVRDGHNVHASQDEGHEYKEDTVILFDFWHGFFLGFHGNGIVSQKLFCAIVRTYSVRRNNVRFPEGAIVAE
jgi:hypothetical protein